MSDTASISPCVYPGCDRDNGDPELTKLGICEPCQRRYHALLEWLVLDWATLHATMPTPVLRGEPTRSGARIYGHPREWASDTAAEIAFVLNWTHDALADHLNETPPPHDHAPEHIRIRHAYRYLEPRVDKLALMPGAEDVAAELHELHRKIRSALGKTRAITRLKGVPCIECNTCALILNGDQAVCGDCGRVVERKMFGLLARHAIDTLIDEYDATHAITV